MCKILKNDIPDFNLPEYESLIYSLNNGTCIFFGAGLSKLAGFKLWEELKNSLIDYFFKNRKRLPIEYVNSFDWSFCENLKRINEIDVFGYLYKISENLFVEGMREIFYDDEKNINNKIYQQLNKFNNGKNFFITTNIDFGFQKYLGVSDEKVSIYPEFSIPPKLINYIHGRIDKPKSWVFTIEQYNRSYVHCSMDCKKFLVYVFKNYNVLFIGYGLREKEILDAILLSETKRMHYWLEGVSRNNEDYLLVRSSNLRENYNIQLIPFSIDSKRYDALYDVLNVLYDSLDNFKEF